MDEVGHFTRLHGGSSCQTITKPASGISSHPRRLPILSDTPPFARGIPSRASANCNESHRPKSRRASNLRKFGAYINR